MAGASPHCQPGLADPDAAARSRAMARDEKNRAERLAAALRENLRKRKVQAREANAPVKVAKAD